MNDLTLAELSRKKWAFTEENYDERRPIESFVLGEQEDITSRQIRRNYFSRGHGIRCTSLHVGYIQPNEKPENNFNNLLLGELVLQGENTSTAEKCASL